MAIDWGRFARIAGGGLASIGTFIFGAPDIWVKTLLVFIVIDYLSGVIAAYINHELSSRTGFIGFLKKTMYFFVLAVAHCVDIATGAGGVLQGIAVGVLISNEGNIHPRKLRRVRYSDTRATDQSTGANQGRRKGKEGMIQYNFWCTEALTASSARPCAISASATPCRMLN